jgi:excisionase family DNA binding protein
MKTSIREPLVWLDIEQAAAYLGLTVRQVRRAQGSGRLSYTKLGGLYVKFNYEQLDAYIADCTVTAQG